MTISQKVDRRVSRTRRLLAQALIELTLEKGYEGVSIREITERADIGYATFFRHYPAKEDLLADVLETFLDELLALVLPISSEVDPRVTGTLVFTHAQKNHELYRVLLSSGSASNLLKRVHEVGTQGILHNVGPKADSPVPLPIAANHVIASFLALIDWWLSHDMPYSPDRMGEIYSELIIKPTQSIAFEL